MSAKHLGHREVVAGNAIVGMQQPSCAAFIHGMQGLHEVDCAIWFSTANT